MEKQFKNIMQDLQKQKGDTGELLVSRLETRLDNIVYRLGFAKTRYQARQFVSHNHVMVNGKKINIPSYRVKKDDVISLTEKMHQKLIELPIEEINVLSFLERDRSSGKLSRLPKREDVQVPFDTQLIIEYYSR